MLCLVSVRVVAPACVFVCTHRKDYIDRVDSVVGTIVCETLCVCVCVCVCAEIPSAHSTVSLGLLWINTIPGLQVNLFIVGPNGLKYVLPVRTLLAM